jgi:hypothetical protein
MVIAQKEPRAGVGLEIERAGWMVGHEINPSKIKIGNGQKQSVTLRGQKSVSIETDFD